MARKQYRKTGGGVLVLADGRKIKPGQKFTEEETKIPKSFMKTLEFLANVPDKPKAEKPKADADDEKITVKNPNKEQPKATTANSRPKRTKKTTSQSKSNGNSGQSSVS